jgi:hypothetical protein
VTRGPAPRLDRRALVDRHAVEVTALPAAGAPAAPLSVGNGELCFTVDVTGMQTFPGRYPVAGPAGEPPGTLLGTLSSWGWHSTPVPGGEPYPLEAAMRTYATPRGPVPYVDMRGSLATGGESPASAAEAWLRANPHLLDLGRIGLVVSAADAPYRAPEPGEIDGVHQRLDLWRGVIVSRFRLRGRPVTVTTVCHPERDVIGLRVETAAAGEGDGLGVRIAFPYGSEAWHDAADWTRPEAHTTIVHASEGRIAIERTLDDTVYRVMMVSTPAAGIARTGPHELVAECAGPVTELCVAFGRDRPHGVPSFAETLVAAARYWERFWTTGGAVELAGSADGRAAELERRVVLSQYLTAINCAGSLPPQETGLTANSWRGRFHLEMHWWHGAHFALWGRPGLLERNLGWYAEILPVARATARRQGYAGARWPKQVGPDGRESPSPIGPFLVWQQPHPIYLAELVRRAAPSPEAARKTVRRYAEIVLETAAFMADFAAEGPDGFRLGPPIIPAQESYADRRAELRDPTFELAYWSWALGVAWGAARPAARAGLGAGGRGHGAAVRARRGVRRGGGPAVHGARRPPVDAVRARLHAADPDRRPGDHAGHAAVRAGRVAVGDHLGLGLPGDRDDRGPARRAAPRRGRPAHAGAEEHLPGQRSQPPEPVAAAVPARQRRPARRGRAHGRGLGRRRRPPRPRVPGRRLLDGAPRGPAPHAVTGVRHRRHRAAAGGAGSRPRPSVQYIALQVQSG